MSEVRAGKPTIDAALVRRLVAAQFPQWSHLEVRPVASGGWDNRTFHLGEQMTARLPSAAAYVAQVEKEHRWLSELAPHLPLPIPRALAMGEPGESYPWPWSVYQWLDGETATTGRVTDLPRFATDLAEFLAALQRIDAADGPPPGVHNFHRGGPLATYDAETRRAIAMLVDRIDTDVVTAVWDAALAAPWRGAPIWLHGDVVPGNLLVDQGRLSAVIDFGCCGVGDPACDLAIAWTFFEGENRDAFRAVLPLDAGAWARGRGWALWKALIVWAGLPGANPLGAEKSQWIVDGLIADHRLTT
jgi:aminoglycoside phosphotransferase (APT) family kinase protein